MVSIGMTAKKFYTAEFLTILSSYCTKINLFMTLEPIALNKILKTLANKVYTFSVGKIV